MEIFWKKMKQEMAAQTQEITESVTKRISENINEKLMVLVEENKNLKTDVKILQDKIQVMEDQKKKNNLIFFGMKEETRYESPIELILNLLDRSMNIRLSPQEINTAYRLGAKKENKPRPILVSFVTNWRRNEVLKNKKKLASDIYIKEDFSKEILEKRKELLPHLMEERAKGKICYFVKDKIVTKEPKADKRKRVADSPNKSPDKQPIAAPKKINKTNMLDYVARARSSSLSTIATKKNDQETPTTGN